MKAELADLLREAAAAGQIRAAPHDWKIINDIIRCRTAALGGHLYRCDACGTQRPEYNSCRNRHCPKCQGGDIAKWLAKRAKELLAVPYFHTVFTVPHGLNAVILQNKAVALDILFRAAAKALQDVAKRSLRGQIGFFAVLHTWGSKLEFHPHLHCVVPGVVLKPDGTAARTGRNYFLPQRKLAIVFRAIFLKLLKRAQAKDKLQFHGASDAQNFPALLHVCAKADWVVYAKKPFAHPEVVLKYLSRYTHRVAISNSRIEDYHDGRVTFSYRDKTQGGIRRHCTIALPEFVRRFLLHTLPRQFVRIRHYGFLANGLRSRSLSLLRVRFSALPITAKDPQPPSCPCCGKTALRYIGEIPPAGSARRKEKSLPMVA